VLDKYVIIDSKSVKFRKVCGGFYMDNLDIKKGDIFWADLSYYGIGVRPVVIISNDEFNKYSSILSGVIVSSNLRTAK